MIIRSLGIRKVFASNALPTIEVEVSTKNGSAKFSVPMGTSTGKHEVVYYPVDETIRKFNMIRRHFTNKGFDNPADVDSTLRSIDKRPDFSDIGGNLAIGISGAMMKAFALEEGKELFHYVYDYTKDMMAHKAKPDMPMPLANVIGGWHGQSDIQEFLLLPLHQKTFLKSVETISDAYHDVGSELAQADPSFKFSKNLESAWVTGLDHEAVLKIMSKIANERYLRIGMDIAGSDLWNGKHYEYKQVRYEDGQTHKLIRSEQIELMADLTRRFPITYIEDPFMEDDFVSHSTLTHRIGSDEAGKKMYICGDDLYATNYTRLRRGIDYKATNAALVKPNQIGTMTDTIKYVAEAKKHGIRTVMSHRSGTAGDTSICHLAVGMGCDFVKFGIAGERIALINEMLRIENRLTSGE